jgi:predicted ribosome quality control (RQC) complex YloA/Tae2 family protein
MHNNFYFLKQISAELEKVLLGTVISECFSQSKAELIIRFETKGDSFYIKASVLPSLSCLSFPQKFERARKNSVDLFPDAIGRRVIGIRQYENERSFLLTLSDGFSFLFKMHGNRSNILFFEGETIHSLFRSGLEADEQIELNSLDRKIDWSRQAFEQNISNLPGHYFTFGKLVWKYLDALGFKEKSADEKWSMIQNLLTILNAPSFFISETENTIKLSLFEFGSVKKQVDDPLRAANEFYYNFTQSSALLQEKNSLLSALRARLQAGHNFIKKNKEKLDELVHNNNYKEWADVLMANLHLVGTQSESVTLDNFYNNNLPIEIKLKKTLSPQKNAEVYYRKSKNQQIEISRLEKLIAAKESGIVSLEQSLDEAQASEDLKALRKIKTILPQANEDHKQSAPLPYHEFFHNGYKIWVGRNAENNDILTFKLSYKEDLWLHAKDVPGSHVLIKHQSGKNFPKDVIERAAELAAYNSKRKNESLCPVSLTPKKFVRKRKGDPAGAVVVEREEVIMVTPKLA